MTTIAPTLGSWTRGQRLQLSVVVAVIAVLHVLGWSLYLSVTHGSAGAGAFAGAGMLAYVLGIRHAFDSRAYPWSQRRPRGGSTTTS